MTMAIETQDKPTQLLLTGGSVAVCNRCGVPTHYEYGRYYGEHCPACRADDEEMVECSSCDIEFLEGDMYPESYYFSPWDDEETDTGYHYCQTCIDHGNDDDQKFYCDGCSREISDGNGRMYYYRILNDCEQVCLRCIETDLLAGGIEALNDDDVLDSVIEDGKPWGMFFNVGELESAGWEAVEGWDDRRFDGEQRDELANTCLALYIEDKPFIIEYERMSMLGDEAYITVRTKVIDNGG